MDFGSFVFWLIQIGAIVLSVYCLTLALRGKQQPKSQKHRVFGSVACVVLAAASFILAAWIGYETVYVLPSIPNQEMGFFAGLLIGMAFCLYMFGLGLLFVFMAIYITFGGKWAASVGLAMVFLLASWVGFVDIRMNRIGSLWVPVIIGACCLASIDALVRRRVSKTSNTPTPP